MPAGAASTDAETIRIHAPFRCIETNKANRAVNVLRNFRDGELWLAAMANRKDGVAALQERRVIPWIDGIVVGNPSAADHISDTITVWFSRLDYVKRQGNAEFATVNDILGASEVSRILRLRREKADRQQHEETKKCFHKIDFAGMRLHEIR